eukprot:3708526-Alexandrium_andersonii.AAC.1
MCIRDSSLSLSLSLLSPLPPSPPSFSYDDSRLPQATHPLLPRLARGCPETLRGSAGWARRCGLIQGHGGRLGSSVAV